MWLLEQKTLDQYEKLSANFTPTVEQKTEFDAKIQAKTSPALKVVKNNIAVIDVVGLLTKTPDFLSMLFMKANTLYPDIEDEIRAASDNDAVSAIQLNVDSPGGTTDGLFDLLNTLSTVTKPMTAKVDFAASAAYAIAAQADTIIANNRGVMTGSIGVATSVMVFDFKVDITSTNAPNKRPDVTTKAGKDVIIERLDAIESLIIESIASGRNTTVANVKKNFGRGGVFLADEAKKRGMIDSIEGVADSTAANSTAENEKAKAIINLGGKVMDLETLKTESPAVYKEAVEIGAKQELDRVEAHLTMGQASGDMKTAVEAIKNGSGMTDAINAKYLAFNMNKNTAADRVADNPEAVTPKNETVDSLVDVVTARLVEGANNE
jgi:ClpP class serine protease